jgi:hypothetical protein
MFRTEDKIAALEAKLKQMEKEETRRQHQSTLPSHPSLPLKPPPTLGDTQAQISTESTKTSSQPQSQPQFQQRPNSNRPHSVSSRSAQSQSQSRFTERKPIATKPTGIFASGSSSSLGKKPTLDELMKARRTGQPGGGIFKK